MAETYMIKGHTHALYKAEDLQREGFRVSVTVADREELWRKGASRAHFLVTAIGGRG